MSRREPPPPENVQLVLADGTSIPVDCVYGGRRHGIRHWRVVNVPAGEIVAMTIGVLPGQTSVDVAFEDTS
jgi:hypothetical protein